MKTKLTIPKLFLFCIAIVQFIGVTSCTTGSPAGQNPIFGTETAEALQPTVTVSPTPIPLAFSLDGKGYSLADFQLELQRYQIVKESSEQTITVEDQTAYVLEQLINQQLLIRSAITNGCTATESDVQNDWEALLSNLPEGYVIGDWLNSRGYTENEFKSAIADSLLEACQVQNIVDTVPDEMEQIHAAQILLSDRNLADAIVNQLQTGVEFATLAYQYDSLTGGDLGWFPQGYLLQPEVDDAVYALQPGEFSSVIESELGYHIVYVYEREVHPLSLDARQSLQQKALLDWMQTERDKTEIVVDLAQ
jgi:peptidyl-prolyl cis-trans isomerase C